MAFDQKLCQWGFLLCTTGVLTVANGNLEGWAVAAGHCPVSSTISQASPPNVTVSRADFWVESDAGVEIFVRELVPSSAPTGVPILLIHGGGPGGIASFDLSVPGYSLAAELAQAGHWVYIMNVRGWEASSRPRALDEPADRNPPAVTADEATRDIGAVVDWIRDRSGQSSVALVGWATGGHWAGLYTTQNNGAVSHLVMLNSLYGVAAPWSLTERFADPNNPASFDPNGGAYRLVDYDGFLRGWDNSIPTEDKTQWRNPAVADAYACTAVALDPTSQTRTPPSARIPTAYREESFNLAQGYQYWDAEDIRTPTLVIRGELDFWSRPEDLSALAVALVNAPAVRTVTVPDATHYLFNDRPERGRDRFIQEVLMFLQG
ncbi:MAG: alpha/beta fold hydrolase [Cyanobacteria bacterium P01_A01_bin.123]